MFVTDCLSCNSVKYFFKCVCNCTGVFLDVWYLRYSSTSIYFIFLYTLFLLSFAISFFFLVFQAEILHKLNPYNYNLNYFNLYLSAWLSEMSSHLSFILHTLFICIICKYLRAAREIISVLIVLPSWNKVFYYYYYWVVWLGEGAGKLPVLGRPAAFAYSRARTCCACSRCRTGGLYFFFIFFICLSFLMSCLLGDGWTWLKYCSHLLNPNGGCQLLPRASSLSTG